MGTEPILPYRTNDQQGATLSGTGVLMTWWDLHGVIQGRGIANGRALLHTGNSPSLYTSLPLGVSCMIDVHCHAWLYPEHFAEPFISESVRSRGREIDLSVRWQEYTSTASGVTTVVMFGGKARLSGLWVPDTHVAEVVRASQGQAIGFLSLDPTVKGWEDELRHGHQDLGLQGVKLMPMYAGFYPHDSKLDPLWRYCVQHDLPVLLHTGTTFVSKAPLDCSYPRHVDDVARKFPDLRIVMAHLGHPFEGECVAVIRKHPHVYADVSALFYRPFQLYQSLMLVQEYHVWNKLLFGSDYPFSTVDDSIKGLRGLNDMLRGTHLPRLSYVEIEGVIERNSLELLGLV